MAFYQLSESSGMSTDRPYECACRKTYKSYPALFTHIKNKHEGIPPGSIRKPTHSTKRLGRPPTNFSKSSIQTEYFRVKSEDSLSLSREEMTRQEIIPPTPDHCITRIAQILANLPTQAISKERLPEITAMMEMTVLMVSKKQTLPAKSIGAVLQQLLQRVHENVRWEKFEQFFTLLMVFSQYIIKQTANNHIFEDQQADLLCSFINGFFQSSVQKMMQEYDFQSLSIFDRKCMLQLFYWCFEWMLQKQYTTYKIQLKDTPGTLNF